MPSVLVMRHPVNPINLNFSECPSFDSEDLLEELGLSKHVIMIVVAAEDAERLENILNVHGEDCSLSCHIFDRQLDVLILKQQVEHTVCPVGDIGAMSEVTQWLLWGALLFLDQRKLV